MATALVTKRISPRDALRVVCVKSQITAAWIACEHAPFWGYWFRSAH